MNLLVGTRALGYTLQTGRTAEGPEEREKKESRDKRRERPRDSERAPASDKEIARGPLPPPFYDWLIVPSLLSFFCPDP
jgi:hypothetical protein